jgi:hypothetical protein
MFAWPAEFVQRTRKQSTPPPTTNENHTDDIIYSIPINNFGRVPVFETGSVTLADFWHCLGYFVLNESKTRGFF